MKKKENWDSLLLSGRSFVFATDGQTADGWCRLCRIPPGNSATSRESSSYFLTSLGASIISSVLTCATGDSSLETWAKM
jgi:hypothetical protein